jgi:hypothetical protein
MDAKMSWIVSKAEDGNYFNVVGGTNSAALELLGRLDVPDSIDNVLGSLSDAGAEGTLKTAFSMLGNKKIERWNSTLIDIGESEKRTLGFPKLEDEIGTKTETELGELTVSLGFKGGIYLVVDKHDDSAKDDAGTGPSGRAVITGGIGPKVRLAKDVKLSDRLNLGIEAEVSFQGLESVEWPFVSTRDDKTAASVVTSLFTLIDNDPSNYDEANHLLTTEHDGVSIQSIVLRRERKFGASGAIKIPFVIETVNGSITASASLEASHKNRIEITQDNDLIYVALKGEEVLEENFSLGLNLSVGLSSIDIADIKRLVDSLGDAGNVLKRIDDAFDSNGEFSLLKSGSAVSNSIKAKFVDVLEVDDSKKYIASRIGELEENVVDRLTEVVSEVLDDHIDLVGADDIEKITEIIADKIGVSGFEDKLEAVLKKALKDLDDRLGALADDIVEAADDAVNQTLSIGPNKANNIARIRKYVSEAKALLTTIVGSAAKSKELSLSVAFVHELEKKAKSASLAKVSFNTNAKAAYAQCVKDPNAYLTQLMMNQGNLPNGVDMVEGSLKGQRTRISRSKLTIDIVGIEIASSFEVFSQIEWKADTDGFQVSGKGGIRKIRTFRNKKRSVEISNLSSFVATQNGFVPATATSDGLAVKLKDAGEKNLTVKDIERLVEPFVEANILDASQLGNASAALRKKREKLHDAKNLGGDVTIDLKLSEEVSSQLLVDAHQAPEEFAEEIIRSVLRRDDSARRGVALSSGYSADKSNIHALAAYLVDEEGFDKTYRKRKNALEKEKGPGAQRIAGYHTDANNVRERALAARNAFAKFGALIEAGTESSLVLSDQASASTFKKMKSGWIEPMLPILDRPSITTVSLFAMMCELATARSPNDVRALLSFSVVKDKWERFPAEPASISPVALADVDGDRDLGAIFNVNDGVALTD